MKEAFYYMFKDNKIFQKYIAIVLSILIPIFAAVIIKIEVVKLIIILLLIPLCMILSGYWISCVKAIVNQKQNIILPYINVKNNIITGFRLGVAELILGLILLLLVLFGVGFTSIVPLLTIVIAPIYLVVSITLLILTIAFTWIFANTDDIYSYIRVSKAIEFISHNKKSYFVAVLLCFMINLLINITTKIMPHNFLFLLTAILVIPYIMFTTAYINAKSINPETTEN